LVAKEWEKTKTDRDSPRKKVEKSGGEGGGEAIASLGTESVSPLRILFSCTHFLTWKKSTKRKTISRKSYSESAKKRVEGRGDGGSLNTFATNISYLRNNLIS